MPLFSPSAPPFTTLQITSRPRTCCTRSSINPSESKMRSPLCTSRGSGVKVVFTRVESPRMRAVVITNCCPALQIHRLAACQRPGANLGPLKIAKNGNGFSLFQRRRAQQRDIRGMFLMSAVRKIQPRHIHPRLQQLFDHAAAICWPARWCRLFLNGEKSREVIAPRKIPRRCAPSHQSPLVNDASGMRSSSPCMRWYSSSVKGKGTNP